MYPALQPFAAHLEAVVQHLVADEAHNVTHINSPVKYGALGLRHIYWAYKTRYVTLVQGLLRKPTGRFSRLVAQPIERMMTPLRDYVTVLSQLGGGTPPPLYKLRPCPSYSRRRDRNNCVRNFNYVRNVVRPHKTWVCRHICQLHGAMDKCNMPHARQIHSQEFEVARAQTSP